MESVRLKTKRTIHKHCGLVNKSWFSWENRLTILKPLYMYTGTETFRKQVVNGGSQVSHHCNAGL